MYQISEILSQQSLTHTRESNHRTFSSEVSASSETSVIAMVVSGQNADFNMPIAKCNNCGGLLGKDIELLGKKRRVPILCQCKAKAQKLDEERMRERELQIKLDKFKAYSLMDANFSISTFESWVFRNDNQDLYNLGKKYCDNWGTMFANNRGLLIHGQAGNGKTFFSFAVANELYKRGISVMAISVARILDIIRNSYSNYGDDGEIAVLDTIRDASLLILDDLGVENKTYWAYEKLYTIIDTRYRAKKPTIITTNLLIELDKPEGINELKNNLAIVDIKKGLIDESDRIYNRIVEMCSFIRVKGDSWRIQKGKENKANMFNELGIRLRN